MHLRAPCLILACLSYTTPLHAQLGFFESAFSKVSDVDAYIILGSPIAQPSPLDSMVLSGALRGLAFEVVLDLGTIVTTKRTKTKIHPGGAPSPCPEFGFSSTLKEIRHSTRRARTRVDSVFSIEANKTLKAIPDSILREVERDRKLSPHDLDDSTEAGDEFAKSVIAECSFRMGISAELGFGYSQTSRFVGSSQSVRAAIEEKPFVTLYASVDLTPHVVPYAGARIGLVSLKDLRAVVSDTALTGSGSTYEYGLLGGLGVGIKGFWLFAEVAWTFRRLDPVEWKPSTNLPPELLSPLTFSARTLALGVQVKLKPGS